MVSTKKSYLRHSGFSSNLQWHNIKPAGVEIIVEDESCLGQVNVVHTATEITKL